MTTYFVDTAFWIALSSRRDQYHSRAIAWYAFVMRTGMRLVTTEAVLWEWLNALADTTTRPVAAEGYRRVIADPMIDVIPFGNALNLEALDIYGRRGDKDWSLTDCLSFVVMDRLTLTLALTTDRHFQQAGMRSLMLEEPPA